MRSSGPQETAYPRTARPVKLRLLGTIQGGSDWEGEIHWRFGKHRLDGEWFSLTVGLRGFIADATRDQELCAS